jgi:putative ABC transport system permease protein
MYSNFFKSTLRLLKKNLAFSFINVIGLAIGIACSVLIMTYVWYELSYDRFNEKVERTYRLAQRALLGSTQIDQTWTSAPMSTALYNEFPEIEYVARITGVSRRTVSYNDNIFIENGALMADSSIFDVFTFPFIAGSPKHALNQPNKVVITESTAHKYFGNENPIGKSLRFRNNSSDRTFEVSGVIKDVPTNSHIHFDFLVSILSFEGYYNGTEWFNNNFRTYIVLQKGYNYKEFEAKLPLFTNKYLFEGRYEEIKTKYSGYWEIYLQPLLDIHLNSDITGEFEPNGKESYVYIFIVVAVIILLIACINFMNLSTAKSSTRAKEVGVRKVVGASRASLISQFIGESVFTSIIALAIGMVIAESLLPAFGNLLGRHIEINYFNNLVIIPLLFSLAIIVGLVSGSYPAFFLSSFKPVEVLKGKLQGGTKRPWLRNLLVVVQFTISIVLIIGTIVIYKQLMFIQNERLGFDKEQVITLRNPYALGNNLNVFVEELKKFEGINNVSISSSIPGKEFNNIGFHCDANIGFSLNLCICDEQFVDVMKLEMVEGRFFSNQIPSDSMAMIINQSAAQIVEWDNPVGNFIYDNGPNPMKFTVIGVVKDFYYESKHQKVRPMALLLHNRVFGSRANYISVRVSNSKYSDIIPKIEENWEKLTNGLPLEYIFLNDEYDALYRNEKQTNQLFVVFSILAIFIACLGLLGLTSYISEQRTKEIGIRKVMGATVSNITLSLSKNFMSWVLISNLFAWPIGYYLMTRWLEDFAYKVSMSWGLFGFATLLSIVIALLTVSYQSIRAATRNPVDSLRYE